MRSKLYTLTVSAGKELIARALVASEAVQEALANGKILIVGGTTNVYLARALCKACGVDFDGMGFYRGLTLGPKAKLPKVGFPGDIFIDHGKVIFGKDVFEIAPTLGKGDIIFKGGNALHLGDRTVGVLVGNSQLGTALPISEAVYGRRVRLICPIGLEKRVDAPIKELCDRLCDPDASGPRLCLLPGQGYCELDALCDLTGCEAVLASAGGVLGGEGCVYVSLAGDEESLALADEVIDQVKNTPAFLQD